MDRWLRVLLLSGLCALATGCASLHLPSFHLPFMKDQVVETPEPLDGPETALPTEATNAEGTPAVIHPVVQRTAVRPIQIDSQDFEVGPYVGVISIQDFGVTALYGARAAYHISEDFFAEASIGHTTTGRTSYERLTGVALYTPQQRDFTYYDLGLSYNLLPGEIFLGRRRALNSMLYLSGGVGAVRFANDDRFSVSVGAGYRVMLNNWLSVRADLRDRVMKSPIGGLGRPAHNVESYVGFTVFF